MYNYNQTKTTVKETVTVYEYENGEVVKETVTEKVTTTEPTGYTYGTGIQPAVIGSQPGVTYRTINDTDSVQHL